MRSTFVRTLTVFSSSWFLLFAPCAYSSEDSSEYEESRSAKAYAKDLDSLIELVASSYVRPESPTDLLFHGLSGLYIAPDAPIPSDLKSECQKADTQEKRLTLATKVRLSQGRKCIFDDRKDMLVSGQALLKSLDRDCEFISPGLRIHGRYVRPHPFGEYGIQLRERSTGGPVIVEEVIPGSPAQKAGLRPMDIVTHINGSLLEGVELEFLFDQLGLYNKRTKAITLTIKQRTGKKGAWDIVLKHDKYVPETVLGANRREDNSWYYWLDRPGRIALIRISLFQRATAMDLQRVLVALEKDGLRGVILDLRWCPGGLIDSSVDVMGLFIKDKNLFTIKSRGSKDHLFKSSGEGKYDKLPITVLINGDTESSAEVIAAAFQDHNRAQIVGQRSMGKCRIRNIINCNEHGDNACITTSMFLRPSGKSLLRFTNSKEDDDWGVRPDPDLEMRLSPDLNRQLKEQYVLQTLRPGASNELLPLDDPAADPVRMRALRLLQRQTH